MNNTNTAAPKIGAPFLLSIYRDAIGLTFQTVEKTDAEIFSYSLVSHEDRDGGEKIRLSAKVWAEGTAREIFAHFATNPHLKRLQIIGAAIEMPEFWAPVYDKAGLFFGTYERPKADAQPVPSPEPTQPRADAMTRAAEAATDEERAKIWEEEATEQDGKDRIAASNARACAQHLRKLIARNAILDAPAATPDKETEEEARARRLQANPAHKSDDGKTRLSVEFKAETARVFSALTIGDFAEGAEHLKVWRSIYGEGEGAIYNRATGATVTTDEPPQIGETVTARRSWKANPTYLDKPEPRTVEIKAQLTDDDGKPFFRAEYLNKKGEKISTYLTPDQITRETASTPPAATPAKPARAQLIEAPEMWEGIKTGFLSVETTGEENVYLIATDKARFYCKPDAPDLDAIKVNPENPEPPTEETQRQNAAQLLAQFQRDCNSTDGEQPHAQQDANTMQNTPEPRATPEQAARLLISADAIAAAQKIAAQIETARQRAQIAPDGCAMAERTYLARALKAVARTVSKCTSSNSARQNLLVEAGEDAIQITTGNGDQTTRVSVPASIRAPFTAIVLAEQFTNFINFAPDAPITLSYTESATFPISVATGHSRLAIPSHPISEFWETASEVKDARSLKISPEEFATAIKLLLPYCAKSSKKEKYNCVEFTHEGAELHLTATDGNRYKRLSIAALTNPSEDAQAKTVFIHSESARHFQQIATEQAREDKKSLYPTPTVLVLGDEAAAFDTTSGFCGTYTQTHAINGKPFTTVEFVPSAEFKLERKELTRIVDAGKKGAKTHKAGIELSIDGEFLAVEVWNLYQFDSPVSSTELLTYTPDANANFARIAVEEKFLNDALQANKASKSDVILEAGNVIIAGKTSKNCIRVDGSILMPMNQTSATRKAAKVAEELKALEVAAQFTAKEAAKNYRELFAQHLNINWTKTARSFCPTDNLYIAVRATWDNINKRLDSNADLCEEQKENFVSLLADELETTGFFNFRVESNDLPEIATGTSAEVLGAVETQRRDRARLYFDEIATEAGTCLGSKKRFKLAALLDAEKRDSADALREANGSLSALTMNEKSDVLMRSYAVLTEAYNKAANDFPEPTDETRALYFADAETMKKRTAAQIIRANADKLTAKNDRLKARRDYTTHYKGEVEMNVWAQIGLYAIATAHENGTVPELLANVRTPDEVKTWTNKVFSSPESAGIPTVDALNALFSAQGITAHLDYQAKRETDREERQASEEAGARDREDRQRARNADAYYRATQDFAEVMKDTDTTDEMKSWARRNLRKAEFLYHAPPFTEYTPVIQQTTSEFSQLSPEIAFAYHGEMFKDVWQGGDFWQNTKTPEGRARLHAVAVRYECNNEPETIPQCVLNELAGDETPAFNSHNFFAREVWRRENEIAEAVAEAEAVAQAQAIEQPQPAPQRQTWQIDTRGINRAAITQFEAMGFHPFETHTHRAERAGARQAAPTRRARRGSRAPPILIQPD